MNEQETIGKITFAKVRKTLVRTIFWLLVGILAAIVLGFLAFVMVSIWAASAGSHVF